jgi:hypothetical protein
MAYLRVIVGSTTVPLETSRCQQEMQVPMFLTLTRYSCQYVRSVPCIKYVISCMYPGATIRNTCMCHDLCLNFIGKDQEENKRRTDSTGILSLWLLRAFGHRSKYKSNSCVVVRGPDRIEQREGVGATGRMWAVQELYVGVLKGHRSCGDSCNGEQLGKWGPPNGPMFPDIRPTP